MIALVNPRLVAHLKDGHSSGIPYLPHGLAYLSAVLKRSEIEHRVIDCFGTAPFQAERALDFLLVGLKTEDLLKQLTAINARAVILYANSVFNFHAVEEIARALRKEAYAHPIVLCENTQAVTGFSVLKASGNTKHLFTHIILGEGEAVLPAILPALLRGEPIPTQFSRNVWTPDSDSESKTNAFVQDLDQLPFPNWPAFPLETYWKLGYAHGPQSGRYLAMLTSRGCPYPCAFCSVPVMNNQRWRMRSAKNVVDEIEYFSEQLGVTEYHWEDLNPTIREDRIVNICQQILDRKLKIRWKIVSGTKMDNLKIETLIMMAKAGLGFISFSPESGSKGVLKHIRKPFDHAHAIHQVRALKKHGVYTQACFVLGFPGETKADQDLTADYSKQLIKAGLGEVAYFIVAPMPGTPIEKQIPGSYTQLSDLTFSPSWRVDYKELVRVRDRLYLRYFFFKAIFQPFSLISSILRILSGSYQLKMEMFPRRRFFSTALSWLASRPSLSRLDLAEQH